MNNKDFKVGDGIVVQGYRGTVTSVTRVNEYTIAYDGKELPHSGCYDEQSADEMRKRGYTVTPTGRTATYFTVDFSGEPQLKGTAYDGGCYGCLDEYECYGKW